MAGTGEHGRRGLAWRAQQRWADMGLLGRIVTAVVAVAVGLLVLLIILAVILAACGYEADGPQAPSTTSASPSMPSPSPSSPAPAESPRLPTVTITAPAPTVTITTPGPTETVTETVEGEPTGTTEPPVPDVYYENCDEARAAGAAPLIAREPGYRPELDADSDGVACE